MPSNTANSPFYPVTAALDNTHATSGLTPGSGKGAISVMVSGTFTGTYYLEATRDDGSTFAPVVNQDGSTTSYTGPAVFTLATPGPDFRYRINSTISSGTANVYLRQSRITG